MRASRAPGPALTGGAVTRHTMGLCPCGACILGGRQTMDSEQNRDLSRDEEGAEDKRTCVGGTERDRRGIREAFLCTDM